MLELDHLAVSARTLAEGRATVEETLGVSLQAGGQHPHFATHNLLLGMEDGFYLEVITIDPDAPKPAYPRWFDLDRFEGPPRLSNWICRTDDLASTLVAAPEGAGRPVALSRGDLNWQMAVPASGVLPFDNCFPALIQWQSAHPAARLAPSGCRLKALVICHPEAAHLTAALAPMLRDPRLVIEAGDPALRAEIETPTGHKVLL